MINISIEPTELSIAEYNLETGTIHFWRWNKLSIEFYRRPGEDDIEMVARIVSHETLHAVIYKVAGRQATFAYDNITKCELRDTP